MKNRYIILLSLGLILLLGSCSDTEDLRSDWEDGSLQPPIEGQALTFVATNPEIEPIEQSRTQIAEDGHSPLWSDDDAIYVNFGEQTCYKFMSQPSTDHSKATFTGVASVPASATKLYAFYSGHFDEAVTELNPQKEPIVSLSVPATQMLKPNTFMGWEGGDMMVALPMEVPTDLNEPISLRFNRLSSVVRVQLEDATSSRKLQGVRFSKITLKTQATKIVGQCHVNLASHDITLDGDAASDREVTLTATSEKDNCNSSNIIVLPTTIPIGDQITILAESPDCKVERQFEVTERDVVLKSGKIITFHIRITDKDLTEKTVVPAVKEGGDVLATPTIEERFKVVIPDQCAEWLSVKSAPKSTRVEVEFEQDTEVNFYLKPNVTHEERSAEVQFVGASTDSSASEQITIRQAPQETFKVLQTEFTVASDCEVIEVPVETNIRFDFIPTVGEATHMDFDMNDVFEGTVRKYRIPIYIGRNYDYDQRVLRLEFDAALSTVSESQIVQVTQEPMSGLYLDPYEVVVAKNGGKACFTVSTNVAFKVDIPSSCQDWVRLPAGTRGLVDKQVCFDISPNTTGKDRECVVAFIEDTSNPYAAADEVTIRQTGADEQLDIIGTSGYGLHNLKDPVGGKDPDGKDDPFGDAHFGDYMPYYPDSVHFTFNYLKQHFEVILRANSSYRVEFDYEPLLAENLSPMDQPNPEQWIEDGGSYQPDKMDPTKTVHSFYMGYNNESDAQIKCPVVRRATIRFVSASGQIVRTVRVEQHPEEFVVVDFGQTEGEQPKFVIEDQGGDLSIPFKSDVVDQTDFFADAPDFPWVTFHNGVMPNPDKKSPSKQVRTNASILKELMLRMRVEPNDKVLHRYAFINVYVGAKSSFPKLSAYEKITLLQKGKKGLDARFDRTRLLAQKHAVQLSVDHNVPYTVEVDPQCQSWAHLEEQSDYEFQPDETKHSTYKFLVDANSSKEPRVLTIHLVNETYGKTISITQDAQFFEVQPNEVNVSGVQQNFDLTIKSNVFEDYTLEAPTADWMKFVSMRDVGKDSATGNLTRIYTYSVTEHQGDAAREAFLTINHPIYGQQIKVVQNPKSQMGYVDNSSYAVLAKGQDLQIKFMRSEAYHLESQASWIELVPPTRAMFEDVAVVRIAPNTSYESRTAKFQLVSDDGASTLNYQVTQYGRRTPEDEEIYAFLEKLYNDLNGDTWPENARGNWLSDYPFSQWRGVRISETYEGKLLDITLNFSLQGKIDIRNCKYLKTLNVSGQYDEQILTDFVVADCPNLVSLYSFYNTISNPMELRNCPKLEYLKFNGAKLINAPVFSNLPKVSDFQFIYCNLSDLHFLDPLASSLLWLDLSNASLLTHVDLNNFKQLYSATFRECENLSQIDVSQCAELQTLSLSRTKIENLDVSHNAKLYNLDVDYTLLHKLDVRNTCVNGLSLTNVPNLTQIIADNVTSFRSIRFESDARQELSISAKNATALNGVEIYAKEGSASRPVIQNLILDLEGCSSLQRLYATNYWTEQYTYDRCLDDVINLSQVNLNGCSNLEYFYFSGSAVGLDFSQLPKLRDVMMCYKGESVNLTHVNSNLQRLVFHKSHVGNLVVDGLPNLTHVGNFRKATRQDGMTFENTFGQIELKNCPMLQRVNFFENKKIDHLTITNCPKIDYLRLERCSLGGLQVTDPLPLVKGLYLSEGRMTYVDCKPFPNLESLEIDNSPVSDFDYSQSPKLSHVDARNSHLNRAFTRAFYKMFTLGFYDKKYSYKSSTDSQGEVHWTVTTRDYGLWFPDEPQSHKHAAPSDWK